MLWEIPTTHAGPAWVQETALDGRTYRLTFRWNTREGAWYLTLADTDDAALAGSMKLVDGVFLLRHIVGTTRPPGELLCARTPTLDDITLGGVLYYLDADGLAAL